jgi:hypothetical protein
MDSVVIQDGYRKDFMQKTFERVLIKDRVTNLRGYSANLRDFTKFKALTKNFEPPNFQTNSVEKRVDMGLLNRKFD